MKKAVLILIFPLLLSLNSKAQLSFIDSTKNEIGITINPIMDAIGISSNDDIITLQYKHHFSNLSLRIGVSGIQTSTYDDASLRNYNYKMTDTLTLIDHFYDTKNTIRFNLGFEQQQMLKNKLKFYYGMDFLGGFSKEESRIERTTFRLQPDSSFKPYHNSNDSVIYSKEHILFGLAFVCGFDYFISKRISAGVQGYFPVSYEFQTGNSRNNTSSLSFDQKISILLRMHF